MAIGREYWIYEVGNSNIYTVDLECWYMVVIQFTVDVGSVEDDWHVRELDLGGIDLNTRTLEIFSKQTIPAG